MTRSSRFVLGVGCLCFFALLALVGFGVGQLYQWEASPVEVGAVHPRSPKWATVRRHYLDAHPCCAACGSKLDPQVHHVKPFHIYPELELSEDNFITLCGPDGHGCHFAIGHLWNYSTNNSRVREVAATLLRQKELAIADEKK